MCLVLVSMLCSCFASSHDVRKADELCKNNGGLNAIWIGRKANDIYCNDGSTFLDINRIPSDPISIN
ncbi:MAG: hypothetical protein KAS32_11215 [Candidatus Peribacteraceae bacterium]|nr:hypothetical protein [Candidatus Peribacteraceae bacterium]